ncbi:alpha/beta fold hydrolase [Geminicoccus harenae]|uniref:alpha/beta fold hydrolase n=1 Tax=Geminicoccus harenae TaxID=2498453 RepID=UPI00168BBB2B|nr:alpha/beta hydrolase [Geminicoccus harenae]
MPTIRTADGVELFYRDWGQGPQTVVFLASWSLSSESWAYQMLPMAEAGCRCIAYDRRGHGRSDDPGRGYDYDTLADELACLMEGLDLREVTLVGYSMGPGEIVRYLTRHGSRRVARVAMLGTVTPMLRQAEDNPSGIPEDVFEQVRRQQLMRDFPQWIEDNIRPFVTPETSAGMIDWIRSICRQTSLQAIVQCNRTITSADFRAELPRIELPVLLLHGEADESAPIALTAEPSLALLPNAELVRYPGAPHGIFLTHAEQVTKDLLRFIRPA